MGLCHLWFLSIDLYVEKCCVVEYKRKFVVVSLLVVTSGIMLFVIGSFARCHLHLRVWSIV